MPVNPLEVVILAAGKGKRMRSALPKALHLVAGQALLGHVLDTAMQLNPIKVHVVVGHGKQLIIEHFADYNVEWVEQGQQLGTGHAVQQTLPNIDDNSTVLMLTADVPLITKQSLAPLCEAVQAFALTLLTATVSDPSGLGRIVRDDTGGVCGIVEQRDASTQQQSIQEINSGIMCARAAELKKWLSELNNRNAQQEYYLTDIVELAYQDGNPIEAFQPHRNFEVEGINSRSQLARVERIYQRRAAEQLMNSGVTIIDPARIDIRGDVQVGRDTVIDVNTVIVGPTRIGSNVRIAPNCVITASDVGDHSQIHANTIIERAAVGEHASIGPFARLRPGTKLSNDVRIGNFVETKNSQLAAGTKVNHLSYVGDATIGSKTNIGAGVITCNYDGANKHQTVIGDNVFVGSNSQLIAPVEIEDGATIGAGSTISSRVGKNQLAISRGRQRQIDGWQRPQKTSADKK